MIWWTRCSHVIINKYRTIIWWTRCSHVIINKYRTMIWWTRCSHVINNYMYHASFSPLFKIMWPNIRFLPSIVAEKNATKNGHIQNVCSMCIKINSRQTGSRNLMGPKTLPTIWGTYMKLVTKYQIPVINSCLEKCAYTNVC